MLLSKKEQGKKKKFSILLDSFSTFTTRGLIHTPKLLHIGVKK